LIGCGSVADKPAIDGSTNPMIDAGNTIDSPPPIDAAIDADLSVKYDVGYINDITVTVNNSDLQGFAVVVNKGLTPLSIQTLSVESYLDDNPGIDWGFSISQAAQVTSLPPGHAAGGLSIAAKSKLVTPGVVPEPIDDSFLLFDMTFPLNPPTVTFNASAVLKIDGKKVTLPFVIHIVGSGNITLNDGKRVSSQP
jgi:hypothetical protein